MTDAKAGLAVSGDTTLVGAAVATLDVSAPTRFLRAIVSGAEVPRICRKTRHWQVFACPGERGGVHDTVPGSGCLTAAFARLSRRMCDFRTEGGTRSAS